MHKSPGLILNFSHFPCLSLVQCRWSRKMEPSFKIFLFLLLNFSQEWENSFLKLEGGDFWQFPRIFSAGQRTEEESNWKLTVLKLKRDQFSRMLMENRLFKRKIIFSFVLFCQKSIYLKFDGFSKKGFSLLKPPSASVKP